MMFRFAALFAATALAAMPAAASTLFTAELQTPVEETTRIAAYDAIWICEADTCEAVLNRRTATVRVCKQGRSQDVLQTRQGDAFLNGAAGVDSRCR